ncbi:MAG: aspartyl protease family protein [Phycisphaerales bacterium JB040]
MITRPLSALVLLAGAACHGLAQDAEPVNQEQIPVAADPGAPADPADLIPTVTVDPDKPNTVNIARSHTGHILFPALVNGRDLGWLMLDTGSSDNVIDVRAAKELGLEPAGSLVTRDFQGLEQTSPVLDDLTITIGNTTIRQPRVVGVDMLPIATMIGQPVIGVVGASTLSQIVIELDYLTPMATIHPVADFDGEGLEWHTVEFDNNSPVIEATYEGNPGTFVLDTGLGFAVEFSRDAVIEHNLLEGRPDLREWSNIGIGGRAEAHLGFVESLGLSGDRFGRLPALFQDPEGFQGPFPNQTGALGSLVFRNYKTTFDLGNARVAFSPAERAAPAGDLTLADIVGTYRDRATGGTMVLDWDGQTVTAILGAGQPELEVVVLEDNSFYFPAAWITGSFQYRDGVIMGLRMSLPDGQSRRALKID